MSPIVHTSNISSCQKKNFFGFPVAVNNSIKVGPFVFMLYVFVIMESIMKWPVFCLIEFELVILTEALGTYHCHVVVPT